MRHPRAFFTLLGFAVALVASACSVSAPSETPGSEAPISSVGPQASSTTVDPPSTTPVTELTLRLVEIDSGFDAPVLLRADPAGGPDFVVEQPGRIVRADLADHEVVLDIRDDVLFNGEQGLLGLAFHPDFDINGLAYVNYVDRGRRTVIEEFTVVNGTFDVSTRRRLLEIQQPAGNHNGGMIEFGPAGNLWIGMGDGGAANDRFGHGQRADTLLGSMLRITVGPGIDTYEIPPDNPFFDGENGAPEVWAIGLRNPWRFTIDGNTVWIADVGQDESEEVNVADASVASINYGWPIMEGDHCFANGCDVRGLHLPKVVYDTSDGCAVTGGVVYRGDAIPEINGHFFYSDFCAGFIRSVGESGGSFDWTNDTGSLAAVSSFGTGRDGEIYVTSLDGTILRIEAVR
ncbi:MAG: sorbosone dehydrogenase family protein [Acidimicrobiia bacterium]